MRKRSDGRMETHVIDRQRVGEDFKVSDSNSGEYAWLADTGSLRPQTAVVVTKLADATSDGRKQAINHQASGKETAEVSMREDEIATCQSVYIQPENDPVLQ
jgi:hypothetical protein